jgi:phosphate-selective porin OprO/OprP
MQTCQQKVAHAACFLTSHQSGGKDAAAEHIMEGVPMSAFCGFRRKWPTLMKYALIGTVSLGMGLGTASAQQPADAKDHELAEMKARMDRLETQNRQLMEMLQQRQVQPASAQVSSNDDVRKVVAGVLKEQDDKKKADEAKKKADAAANGYEVGSDLSMGVRWNPTNGVTFETPNKDFVSHIGVRFQLDDVFFNQSGGLIKPTPAGIGNLDDGTFFRRVRPSWDGTAYDIFEWNVELALEQTLHGVNTWDEMWVGIKEIPYIGTVRVGHQKTPQGFEGDMVSSSKAMTFLERSSYTDAFYQNFSTGIQTTNSFMDQRATYTFMYYRQDNDNGINADSNGVSLTDGTYGYGLRVTALPMWENNGRCFVHLGASANFRDAERLPPGIVGPREVQFRARPQMRDAIGDFGTAPNDGNSVRLVDTGKVQADGSWVLGTEALWVMGPLSVQAEYAFAAMENAVTLAGTNVRPGTPVGTHLGDVWFNGGYIQVSYFLTGENRGYDRRLGREASTYIAGAPNETFFFVRDEDNRIHWGSGAWELAARLNHLTLNSDRINGGETNALELGVNWYLSNNLKFQFEYLWQDRFDMKPGVNSGSLNGLGIRTQFFF